MSGSIEKKRNPAGLKRGPISRKVVAALERERRRRVIDFSALKLGGSSSVSP
jgi:hypothetical protein